MFYFYHILLTVVALNHLMFERFKDFLDFFNNKYCLKKVSYYKISFIIFWKFN